MTSKGKIVIDLDGTLTIVDGSAYGEERPNSAVVNALHEYRQMGFEIAIHTARNMRTHNSSMGKLTAKTLPIITDWLVRHNVPYDEIWVGKPWCGSDGFYVDDRAIRPSEFATLSKTQIDALLAKESDLHE